MSRFSVIPTPLDGLVAVERQCVQDERGFFSRFFCAEELRPAGFDQPVAQINHTLTHRRGAIRGMHFQHPPHSEVKLVSCLRGKVFDVAVDLRHGSPTLLHWHAETLTAENGRSLLIPRGFAHGFQALDDDCELLYLHCAPYVAEAEGAVYFADPALAIRWPLAATDVSERDRRHPPLAPGFTGFRP
jgi:dTDP-4-dehydrorhamnose 3,5-epimerase